MYNNIVNYGLSATIATRIGAGDNSLIAYGLRYLAASKQHIGHNNCSNNK